MLGGKMQVDHAGPTPSKTIAILVGAFAAFGGFLFGYDTAYISGVKEMAYFQSQYGDLVPGSNPPEYRLATSTDSLITSILSAGTFIGAISSAFIGTKLGRRYGLLAYILVFCAGVGMQMSPAGSVPIFAVGRVLAGFGVGGVSCLVPIYQSEISPKAWRGGIVSCYQLFITIGLLIAAIVVERTKGIDGPACYQIPIGLQYIWAAIIAAGLVFMPESPRWLCVVGREEDARRSLSRLFKLDIDSPYVSDELANIASNVHHERSLQAQANIGYAELLWRSGPSRLPFRVWTGICLQALQQLSGINFIFYYGTTFFRRSGIANPFLITIATNVVNVGMTIPGIWAVDKLGRRKTMIYGAFGMAVCQLIVAATGTAIGTGNPAGQKVLVAFVCIYIAHFAAIWGPYAWVITGEIVPNVVRSKAVSLTTGSQWLWNFGIGYATPYMVDPGEGRANLGAKVFFIWGGFCFIAIAFAYFTIPETKGLSLEQIDIMYRNSSIVNSPSYRKKMLAEDVQDETKDAYYAADGQGKHSQTHIESKRDLEQASV